MIVFLLVFIFALFIYIHVLFQWKVSNEIDIPHISLPDKDTLEQVADSHQPFIFEKDLGSSLYLEGIEREINVQKIGETPIKVPHKAMLSAVKKEPYISQKNASFLERTQWMHDIKKLSVCDTLLKPYMNWKTAHDIIYGNKGVYTELCCSPVGRNYFAVVEGYAELKLCTPRSGEFLTEGNANGTKSNVNIWDPSENDKTTLKECDTILIPLQKGSIIHIPAYWWYSFKFTEVSCIISFSYSTYMNAISQVPSKIQQVLQKNKIEV